MRLAILVAVTTGAAAQFTNQPPQANPVPLERVKHRALAESANTPNYVCANSIERSMLVPGERTFRQLDRIYLEVTHVAGADRFAWLGNSSFESGTPTAVVGHGAGFGGDFADSRNLIFKNESTGISYAGSETMEDRPALRYEFQVPRDRGGLWVGVGNQQGRAAVRGSFWIQPETLDLIRIDLERYDIPAHLERKSVVVRTMYWRVRIGEKSVLLPRNSEFLLTSRDDVVRRNSTLYLNCREYKVESNINFGADPTAPDRETRIAAGLELHLELGKAVDPHRTAIGEPVRATVLKAAGSVPKGAEVKGRVIRIIRYGDHIPLPNRASRRRGPRRSKTVAPVWGRHADEVLIGIEFATIEFRGSRAPFVAALMGLVSQPGASVPPVRSFGYFEDGGVVRLDAPGTAHIYLSAEDSVLPRGVVMNWVTVR